jgi:cyanophycinase
VSGGVHLVGGGWGGDPRVWTAFTAEAAARSGRARPRVVVVAVRDGDEQEHAAKLLAAVEAAASVDPVVLALREGDRLDPGAIPADVDGVLVGGGLTPAYADAVAPAAARIRALVADGVPYAGFSAGSAIAPVRALVAGWRHLGRPVLDEEVAEERDELAVVDGIGLVPFAVDVHAAQWGTTSRLLVAVEAGLVPDGVAVDEDTAVVVQGGAARVVGTGSAWWASPAAGGVLVRREPGD